MKKKMDFITNSSSASFIACVLTFEFDDLKQKYGKRLFELYKQKGEKDIHKRAVKNGAFMTVPSKVDPIKLEEEYNEFLDDDFAYSVECSFEETGLSVRAMPYESSLMVGKCPFSMKPDQTLNEYKQEICDAFKQCGINVTPDKLGQIEECWMDN